MLVTPGSLHFNVLVTGSQAYMPHVPQLPPTVPGKAPQPPHAFGGHTSGAPVSTTRLSLEPSLGTDEPPPPSERPSPLTTSGGPPPPPSGELVPSRNIDPSEEDID